MTLLRQDAHAASTLLLCNLSDGEQFVPVHPTDGGWNRLLCSEQADGEPASLREATVRMRAWSAVVLGEATAHVP